MPTVKEAIKEMGLDRMGVALRLQVSYETVRKWEYDDKVPKGPANILFWRLYEELSVLNR